jgi:hypothetical protein
MRRSSTPLFISLRERCLRAWHDIALRSPAPGPSERSSTRRLAVILASLLSGVSTALIIPLLLPSAGWVAALSVASAAALWPVLIDWIRAPREPHPWSLFSGILVSAPLAVLAHSFYHPPLRVLNLSDRTVTILVDGKPVFTLPATSLESPRAGAELQLPLGPRELSARDSRGALLTTQTVHIVAGHSYLYAPLSARHCFTIETTRYGKAGTEVTSHRLPEGADFWVLPTSIDLWLTPAPESKAGSRWSGGTVTALRHRPCGARTSPPPGGALSPLKRP